MEGGRKREGEKVENGGKGSRHRKEQDRMKEITKEVQQ